MKVLKAVGQTGLAVFCFGLLTTQLAVNLLRGKAGEQNLKRALGLGGLSSIYVRLPSKVMWGKEASEIEKILQDVLQTERVYSTEDIQKCLEKNIHKIVLDDPDFKKLSTNEKAKQLISRAQFRFTDFLHHSPFKEMLEKINKLFCKLTKLVNGHDQYFDGWVKRAPDEEKRWDFTQRDVDALIRIKAIHSSAYGPASPEERLAHPHQPPGFFRRMLGLVLGYPVVAIAIATIVTSGIITAVGALTLWPIDVLWMAFQKKQALTSEKNHQQIETKEMSVQTDSEVVPPLVASKISQTSEKSTMTEPSLPSSHKKSFLERLGFNK